MNVGLFATAMSFVPTQIAGCQLWLDASDASTITQSGSPNFNVSQWNDKSGNARNVTQGTGADEPVYFAAAQNGLSVIQFDGVSDYMSGSALMLRSVAGWSAFMVLKPATNTPAAQMNAWSVRADSGSGAVRATITMLITSGFWGSGGRRNNADAFGADNSTTQASTSVYSYVTAVGDYTNTDAFLRLNGSQIATNASWLTSGSTPNDEGALYVGTSAALSAFFNGRIGEIIVYGSALSSGNQVVVETYLKSKWGL